MYLRMGRHGEIFALSEMKQRFVEGPARKCGGDHVFTTYWILGREIFKVSALAPLCGSLGWDNHRIKQRPNPLNPGAFAPEHCI
jgi:hypothetical protein